MLMLFADDLRIQFIERALRRESDRYALMNIAGPDALYQHTLRRSGERIQLLIGSAAPISPNTVLRASEQQYSRTVKVYLPQQEPVSVIVSQAVVPNALPLRSHDVTHPASASRALNQIDRTHPPA